MITRCPDTFERDYYDYGRVKDTGHHHDNIENAPEEQTAFNLNLFAIFDGLNQAFKATVVLEQPTDYLVELYHQVMRELALPKNRLDLTKKPRGLGLATSLTAHKHLTAHIHFRLQTIWTNSLRVYGLSRLDRTCVTAAGEMLRPEYVEAFRTWVEALKAGTTTSSFEPPHLLSE